MAAGYKYSLNPIEGVTPEMCRVETIFRHSGGFNLVLDNLSGVIPPLCPLAVDFRTHKATPVINVKVHEKITAGVTALKVAKNSLAYVGMHLGNGKNGGTVEKVDKSNKDYDLLTLKASPTLAAEAGDVLFESTAVGGTVQKSVANALNYTWAKVEPGATVDAIGQAYEIRLSKLIVPVSLKDQESLGARFMFIY